MHGSGESPHRGENYHQERMKRRAVDHRVKIFESDEYAVIFDGKNISVSILPLQTYRTFISKDKNSIPVAPESSSLFTEERKNIDALQIGMKNDNTKRVQSPALAKLSLNVSNTCNMACRYCYAAEGTYYTTGILMNKDTALNAVTFAYRNFSTIGQVNFFGGEPTLNEQIIELICEYFIYLRKKGVIPMLPRFGLTTNGYAMSKRMFHILRKYNLGICISLDGPREIHNVLRPDKKNSKTFDVIVNNIQKIIDMGIIPEFECTYTAEHYRNGIDLLALMDFFYEKFKCNTLHCPMVISNPNTRWFVPIEKAAEIYAKGIQYSVSNLVHGIPKSISLTKRFLYSLTTKTPICHYCPAGKASLTINADGNIYACFMLMQGAEFCLGNVNSKQLMFEYPEPLSILLRDANKSENSSCQKCWAQPLCFGCLGEDLARRAEFHRSEIPGRSKMCDLKRKMVEVFLLSIAEANIEVNRTG